MSETQRPTETGFPSLQNNNFRLTFFSPPHDTKERQRIPVPVIMRESVNRKNGNFFPGQQIVESGVRGQESSFSREIWQHVVPASFHLPRFFSLHHMLADSIIKGTCLLFLPLPHLLFMCKWPHHGFFSSGPYNVNTWIILLHFLYPHWKFNNHIVWIIKNIEKLYLLGKTLENKLKKY